MRDISVSEDIGINTSFNLGKMYFQMDLDPYFRSTITEARLFMALYLNFKKEIDDCYLKYSIIQ
jgi:hypothetical protein